MIQTTTFTRNGAAVKGNFNCMVTVHAFCCCCFLLLLYFFFDREGERGVGGGDWKREGGVRGC